MDRLVPGIVLAFAGGIAAARGLDPGLAAALLLGGSLLAFAAARRPAIRALLPPPWEARASPSLLVLAALLGAARAGVDALPPGPDELERILPDRALPVLLEGTVAAPPGLLPPRGGGGGEVLLLEVECDGLLGPGGRRAAGGRVEAFVEGNGPDLLPGDRIRIAGVARPPSPPRNPGARDRAAAARGRGIARTLDVPGPGAVVLLARGGPSSDRAAGHLRAGLLAAVRRAFRGEGRALYEALLAGRPDALDPGLVRDFRRTGTWHVIVVSGIHVALAAGAAAWILGRAGCGPGVRAAGVLLGAWAYAAASGSGVPSRRALAAVALVALAPLLRRRADPLHALFAAAGLLMAARPAVLGEAGFQLSFAAVLGILRLAPGLGDLLFARRRFLRRFPIPAADRSLRRRGGDILEAGLPTALAAWAATAPILAFHFGTFGPVTPLANLAVVPGATAALALGAVLLPVGAVLPAVSAPLGDAAAALLGVLVAAFAALPGACLLLPPPPPWLLAADAACLAAACLRPGRGTLLAVAAGLAALAAVPLALPPRPPAPSILALDTGHGLSVLCDGGGSRILYDAGGRGPRVGAEAILPALRARGAGALEAVVVSHEDEDHLSAVREVIESVPVGLLIVNEGFGASGSARAILDAAAREGVPVRRSAAGDRLSWPGLRLEILHPARGLSPRPPDNDGSLVALVRMEGLSVLLPGDLESGGVRRLLESGADLRADVLLLPHHGSPLVEGVDLLAAASRARVLVASAGPGTLRLDRVPSPYAPLLRCTATEGAVEVGTAGTGP